MNSIAHEKLAHNGLADPAKSAELRRLSPRLADKRRPHLFSWVSRQAACALNAAQPSSWGNR